MAARVVSVVRLSRIGSRRRGAQRRRRRPEVRRRGRLGEPPATLLRTTLLRGAAQHASAHDGAATLLRGAANGRPRTERRTEHRRARRLHLPLRQRTAATSAHPLERELDGPSAQGCRGRSGATKSDRECQRVQSVDTQRSKILMPPEEPAQASSEARRAVALCTHRRDVGERQAYLWGKAP